jgi:hypothetical protein
MTTPRETERPIDCRQDHVLDDLEPGGSAEAGDQDIDTAGTEADDTLDEDRRPVRHEPAGTSPDKAPGDITDDTRRSTGVHDASTMPRAEDDRTYTGSPEFHDVPRRRKSR